MLAYNASSSGLASRQATGLCLIKHQQKYPTGLFTLRSGLRKGLQLHTLQPWMELRARMATGICASCHLFRCRCLYFNFIAPFDPCCPLLPLIAPRLPRPPCMHHSPCPPRLPPPPMPLVPFACHCGTRLSLDDFASRSSFEQLWRLPTISPTRTPGCWATSQIPT